MNHPYLVFVGTYTQPPSESRGIYVYRYQAGHLTPLGLAAATTNPSFLAVDPSHRYLYAVNETQEYHGEKSGSISAFLINHKTGNLTFLNEVATGGTDPCFVSIDPAVPYVLVANYTSGSVAVFPVLSDGRLGARSSFVQHTGHSVNPDRQEGPHAHCILMSPDRRFALAADLGLDKLLVYHFNPHTGGLTPNQPPYIRIRPGSGPRHFVFDRSGLFIYLLSEVKSTITVLAYNPREGTAHELQTVSSLPHDFKGDNTAAEIELDPSGRFLYASNRGDDSLAMFSVDPQTHKLSHYVRVASGGKTPRNFALDPSGRFLLAANQDSNNLVLFHVDHDSGRLTPSGTPLQVSAPVCVVFVPVP